eukprot:3593646-Rhodomonas_salina.1
MPEQPAPDSVCGSQRRASRSIVSLQSVLGCRSVVLDQNACAGGRVMVTSADSFHGIRISVMPEPRAFR